MAVNLNIPNFITVAGRKDFARNNLFRVLSLKCRGLELDESDLLYCKGGALPGRNNPTSQVQYHGMKLSYNNSTVDYPGADDYQLKFYCDADSALRKKFEEASRLVFNDVSNTGNWRFPSTDDIITLASLDFNLDPREYIKLIGVCFKGIDAIDFQAADGDGSAIEITAHFSFLYYRRDGSNTIYSEN
jgi:hypothetical protein